MATSSWLMSHGLGRVSSAACMCVFSCIHVCVRTARMDVHHHLDLDEYNMSFYEMVVMLLVGYIKLIVEALLER